MKKGYDISRNPFIFMVPRDGIEPPTRGFTIPYTYFKRLKI